MKYLRIGITASLFIHFAVFLIFAKVATSNLKNNTKLVVNFSVISKPVIEKSKESIQPEVQKAAPPVPKTEKKIVPPKEITKKVPVEQKISPLDVTSHKDIQNMAEPVSDNHRAVTAGDTVSAATDAQPKGGKVSHEEAKQKYVKENFIYIRDMVMKQVSYPHSAKKMGICGKVTISFVVTESGVVDELKVEESSGHGLLDDSAINAVKQAAPFPKPVVSAKIVLPITYKLDKG
ncbi:MAG: energy transducer TonB [Nitrospirae bacterium YQR-1]